MSATHLRHAANGTGGGPCPVFLFHHGKVVAFGEAPTLAPDGTVVAALLGPHAPLPRGCCLEMGVGIERDGITRRYRIPVRVVSHSADAVALAFDAEDADLVTVVMRALAQGRDGG